MSLFTVFDPCSWFGFKLNFVVIVFFAFFFYWNIYEYVVGFLKLLNFIFMKFVSLISEVNDNKGVGSVVVSFFILIFLFVNNFLGLFPFVYSMTSHLIVTLGLGLVSWFSCFLMGWGYNFFSSAGHLVPEGSPLILSPLMVMIESMSHLMRPFTLSIRLAANMMAGHLIVGLLSIVSMGGLISFVFSVLFQLMLMLLELMVSLVQGFVFGILLSLYFLEYY